MPEPKLSRRRQADHRRVQLLDSALEVFAAKGIERATIKELSKAAGVSEGLMYHYFKSKEDLLNTILEERHFLPDLRRIIAPDGGQPVGEVILQVVSGFAAVLQKHDRLVRLLIRESSTNSQVADRLARARREGVRMLSEYLDARVATGELRQHDSESVARLLFAAALSTHLAFSPDDAHERFLSSVVEVVLHGIAAQ